MVLILSLLVGLSFGALAWAIFVIEKELSPNVLRRLTRIKNKVNKTDEEEEQERLNLLMESNSEFSIPQIGEIIKNWDITEKIKNLLRLADSQMKVDSFIYLSLLCAFPFLLMLVTPLPMMGLLGIGAMFIPYMNMNMIINKRFNDFSKQFPDALNLMSSSLRAGHPLFSAIDIVTTEMPKPICTVFATATKDLSLGADTKDAFMSMTKVMPKSIDLRFFITAVLIQKEVGGNLAELLDSLSDTIRERFKLIAQLRVQTAQTRMSGMVLGCVPVVIAVIVYFLNPEYIKPLFETPDGQLALFIAVAMTIIGFVAIKKVSTIEV